MKLRDYQQNALDAVATQWAEGIRSTLVVMPTGTGKTVLFSGIIESLQPRRAMVIAHREELIWQARKKIEAVTGLRADVEMGNHKAFLDAELFAPRSNVIVSTIQTHCAGGDGGGRMSKFDPMDFGLLIIDEAHHSTAAGYRRVLDYYLQNPNLVVVGVTATPDRTDEEALGQIFQSVAYDYEILDAIRDGWLVPIDQQMVSIEGLDFSAIRTTAGDLNGADLDAVMEQEKNIQGIAGSTIEIIGGSGKRGIGFASSVEQARVLSNIFNRHRSGMSNWVCGKTDKDERKQIIADFAAGKVQFLWNCGVFTEGFDDSGVEVIVMGRPTKSRSLYAQMAGRGTRPHESVATRLNSLPIGALRRGMIARSIKPSCLILDFVGNSGKHKLMTSADVLGGNVSEEAVQAAVEFAKRSGRPVRMAEVLEDEEKRIEEKKKRQQEEAARKAKLVAKAKFKTQSVDPFDAFQIKPVVKNSGFDKGKKLSEGQRGVFRDQLGIDPDEYEEVHGYTKSKQLIDEHFKRRKEGLCGLRMIKFLKKYGLDGVKMKKEVASAWFEAIKGNNWHKPFNFQPPTQSAPKPLPPSRPQPQTLGEVLNGVVQRMVAERGEIPEDDIPF